jgi:hypothetical protein
MKRLGEIAKAVAVAGSLLISGCATNGETPQKSDSGRKFINKILNLHIKDQIKEVGQTTLRYKHLITLKKILPDGSGLIEVEEKGSGAAPKEIQIPVEILTMIARGTNIEAPGTSQVFADNRWQAVPTTRILPYAELVITLHQAGGADAYWRSVASGNPGSQPNGPSKQMTPPPPNGSGPDGEKSEVSGAIKWPGGSITLGK